jgi:SulP family sulfate permease
MKKYFPILQWFPKLTKRSIRKDAIAGTIVGIVLIPQGIAYALIAGLPPIYGLYTALLPQLVYAVLGTSSKIAIGPVATDSLIVAAAIASLSVTGPENSIAIALTLACAVGVLQLLMGFLKLGFVINFLSKPVISGFISAAAIIIALSQLRNFFGISIPRSNRI